MSAALLPGLEAYVRASQSNFAGISAERSARLECIAEFVADRAAAALLFVCTHNSRRSHLAQIWAATGAAYYGLSNVSTFSGGTEATELHSNAAAALGRAGFEVEREVGGVNPIHRVRFSAAGPTLEVLSKRFDAPPNPLEGFCAVMTCAEADANCPVLPGASLRVALPYEDPKAFDETTRESEAYDERCREISVEMLYLCSRVTLGRA